MKKFAIAAFAVFAALFATLVMHTTAQAYPNVQASLSASDKTLVSGQEFAVTASSSTECDWALEWDGLNRAVRGTQFQTTFVAPEVDEVTTMPLSGVCTYEDPAARAADDSITPASLSFTIRPTGEQPNGAASLAGTGGPDRLVLLSGVGLLIVGATVAVVARRRAEHAELVAQTA